MYTLAHSYTSHDSFTRVVWYMQIHAARLHAWHDADMCVTWLICMCEMTHSYAWYDAFMCIKRLCNSCNTLQRSATLCSTQCTTLQHALQHTLQHTPTLVSQGHGLCRECAQDWVMSRIWMSHFMDTLHHSATHARTCLCVRAVQCVLQCVAFCCCVLQRVAEPQRTHILCLTHVFAVQRLGLTCEWVMSHIWHVLPHKWLSHAIHMDKPHVTRVDESCHSHEWVNVWMRHVTHD